MPGCVVELFATDEAMARHHDIAGAVADTAAPVLRCDERAIAALVGSVSPQGMVAVCAFVDVLLEDAVDAALGRPSAAQDGCLVVVAAHVREPGNAGSLVRLADATGAAVIVFAGSSVDPYNDKAVRASVGSIFHVPIVTGITVTDAIRAFRHKGFRVLAADGDGAASLDAIVGDGLLTSRTAWIFGNEAWGVPPEERAMADAAVAVPIYGRAESFNVATAAAICLYATAREHHRKS